MAFRCLAKTMESGREYGNNNGEVTTTIGTATIWKFNNSNSLGYLD